MVTLRGRARRAVFVAPGLLLAVLLAVLLGCHPPVRSEAAPGPHRALASADAPAVVPPGAVLANPSDLDAGLRKPRHVLALSSGGLYGAYSAGVLDGWTRTGARPEFDVVTGTSTGALIAPFAFLGGAYDARAVKLYTGVRAQDIFRPRAWFTIPFRDALATSAPLRRLIEAEVSPELLGRVAEEHRKGRRLYIGTTDLRTKRAVIWDMGAIACRPGPDGGVLFRDVLLASASIPGVAPPVPFRVEIDGRPETEYHTDGGITAPLFVPPNVFMSAAPGPGAAPAFGGASFYAIVAGKLYPDEGPVRRRILPVLGASAAALLLAHTRAELANMYWQSRFAGLRFHMIALRQDADIHADSPVSFDQELMTRLYEEGRRDGEDGPNWMYAPPALSPCDGGYARGSSRLRTMPAVPVSMP